MEPRRILMGVVGRPHGVRGLVHVHSYAEGDLAEYALVDGAGRAWRVVWRGEGIAALLDAQGRALADREAAARMTNTELFVDRAQLAEAEADEFYLADLVGLRAVSVSGEALGRVVQVHDYGAGASLELDDGMLVPFTRAAVPEVDVLGGLVVVEPPVVVDGEAALTPTLSQRERESVDREARGAGEATLTPALSQRERESVDGEARGAGEATLTPALSRQREREKGAGAGETGA